LCNFHLADICKYLEIDMPISDMLQQQQQHCFHEYIIVVLIVIVSK